MRTDNAAVQRYLVFNDHILGHTLMTNDHGHIEKRRYVHQNALVQLDILANHTMGADHGPFDGAFLIDARKVYTSLSWRVRTSSQKRKNHPQ